MLTDRNFHRYTMPFALGAAIALSAVGSVRGVHAQSIMSQQEREYQECMRLTRLEPALAFETALAWQDMGGGLPARHCEAVSLLLLGHHAEAATRLEMLAAEMPDDAPPESVSDVLAHAGIAWVEAGNLDRAVGVQTAAIDLTPDSAVFRVDRALSYAQLGRYWEAIDDLNRAIELDPFDPDAYAMRASAYRFVDVNDLAMEDAEHALELDSEHPEGLLERGNLHRLMGNPEAARRDWLRLIELHNGRPAAEDAKRNLELLDVDPDAQ